MCTSIIIIKTIFDGRDVRNLKILVIIRTHVVYVRVWVGAIYHFSVVTDKCCAPRYTAGVTVLRYYNNGMFNFFIHFFFPVRSPSRLVIKLTLNVIIPTIIIYIPRETHSYMKMSDTTLV